MRNLCRCLAWICFAILPAGMAAHAQRAPAKPLLDGMAAMQTSLAALHPEVGDGAISAITFDSASGVWHFRLDRDPGKNPASLEVTLDETTGAVCAHDPASGQCVAQGSAAAQLREARERHAAQEDAVLHLAPDLQGVMIALVRYQVTAEDGYLHANRMPVYVSMSWPDGSRKLDLSPAAIQRLADSGLRLFPGSAWPSGKAPPDATMMQMSVGLPMRRQDGDFDIQYTFWCGALCASWHTAVLRHDANGWHVLTSRMDAIS
ncbi:hypothetical protein [Frateuria terrea]|uniref:Peptidase propeptide and YPEB domain-containing protein n=1 Tax=Frateuria terrea TaxID=529704 RepID=A0A1H6QLR6_9GAMM|nr:hypothetical protein [Frateuria terrea]SEI44678.1 hypothetical protein SAMN04487997_0707 [Frateuria terrea]SFP10331.1 hypothetical protein SAMN02927913_0623 [Frateuria terrea]